MHEVFEDIVKILKNSQSPKSLGKIMTGFGNGFKELVSETCVLYMKTEDFLGLYFNEKYTDLILELESENLDSIRKSEYVFVSKVIVKRPAKLDFSSYRIQFSPNYYESYFFNCESWVECEILTHIKYHFKTIEYNLNDITTVYHNTHYVIKMEDSNLFLSGFKILNTYNINSIEYRFSSDIEDSMLFDGDDRLEIFDVISRNIIQSLYNTGMTGGDGGGRNPTQFSFLPYGKRLVNIPEAMRAIRSAS